MDAFTQHAVQSGTLDRPHSIPPQLSLLKYHRRYTQGCVFMVILHPAKLLMKFNHHRSQNKLYGDEKRKRCAVVVDASCDYTWVWFCEASLGLQFIYFSMSFSQE